MSITTYTPNKCKYRLGNLKKVVYLYSSASVSINIDNGEAYVSNYNGNAQILSGNAINYTETTSYNDRFQFAKNVSITCDGYVNLSSLNDKYYVILEDYDGNYWLVNYDFPSHVTYTYTLVDGENQTEFVLNALSNFPTLKLNWSSSKSSVCKQYDITKIKSLKMLEKRYAAISTSASTVYGYSSKTYKTVDFNEGSLRLTEEFDGFNVSTTLQFDINMDAYQPSWQYNLLEYQDNRYVALINGEVAVGFENGLIPSYNAQGSHEMGSVDKYTITLNGSSVRGLYTSSGWTEVSLEPQYTWILTNESTCLPTIYRWEESGTTCIKYDKYQNNIKQYSVDNGETWKNVIPEEYSASTLIEADSEDCGYRPYSASYLTLVALEDSDNINVQGVGYTKYFSLDYGNTWVTSYNGSISEGDEILVKGGLSGYNRILATGFHYNIQGNIMSLIYNDNFVGETSLEVYVFESAFSGCTGLTSAENLIMPATELAKGCYTSMFQGCTSLTTAPQLPATSLAEACYSHMFEGCTSLTTAPELISSGIANYCYIAMFLNCTSLTTPPPQLLSTEVRKNCYNSMFQGCTSLTTAPRILATTINLNGAEYCYHRMFKGCTSLETAPELLNTTVPNSGCAYMFQDCTSLTTVPSLPFTSVGDRGCLSMFQGCTSLVNVPQEIPATSITGHSYDSMFQGCTSLTTAPILPATSLPHHAYYRMFYGCSSLNSITCLATSISTDSCTTSWVSGVAASGTFTKATGVNWPSGGSGIPSGWVVLNAT